MGSSRRVMIEVNSGKWGWPEMELEQHGQTSYEDVKNVKKRYMSLCRHMHGYFL